MTETKLLYPFSGVKAIFFPVGKPPRGTCEFSTDKCLTNCAAFKNADLKNIIGYRAKKHTLDYFKKESVFKICDKIIEELSDMDERILYWFASGDCPKSLQGKIINIIHHLIVEGIIQLGFTRNECLWEKTQSVSISYLGVHLAFTVESTKEAREKQIFRGLVAVPNYKTSKISLYKANLYSGSCGESRKRYDELRHEDNCMECYQKEIGCFARG